MIQIFSPLLILAHQLKLRSKIKGPRSTFGTSECMSELTESMLGNSEQTSPRSSETDLGSKSSRCVDFDHLLKLSLGCRPMHHAHFDTSELMSELTELVLVNTEQTSSMSSEMDL